MTSSKTPARDDGMKIKLSKCTAELITTTNATTTIDTNGIPFSDIWAEISPRDYDAFNIHAIVKVIE